MMEAEPDIVFNFVIEDVQTQRKKGGSGSRYASMAVFLN
jgi:hypothetical protein